MDILRLIFQLGVFFAIYSFIWFFIDAVIKLFLGGTEKSLMQTYFFKAIKYVFLVNVIFLFSISDGMGAVNQSSLLPVVFILALYFMGKLQKDQSQSAIFARMGMNSKVSVFNTKYEVVLISFAFFSFFVFFVEPSLAQNQIALWFKESIVDIESTVIIGFVFKIIGFFFLLGILAKTLNAFKYIMNLFTRKQHQNNQDRFDDFEEVE